MTVDFVRLACTTCGRGPWDCECPEAVAEFRPLAPKPYFEANGITIYHGDAREILPTLGPVDHIITDPPYSPRAMKNARRGSTIKAARDGKTYDFGYEALSPELRTFAAGEFARLARRWCLIWSDIETAHLWRDEVAEAGLRYVRTGIWVREHGAPQFSGDRPTQAAEACVIAHSAARMRWNGRGRPATWIGPIVNPKDPARQGHASPKPAWLMRRLVLDFTDVGETVIDPFMGAGSLLRAALDMQRRAIGIELSEEHCERAARRMEQACLDFGEGPGQERVQAVSLPLTECAK